MRETLDKDDIQTGGTYTQNGHTGSEQVPTNVEQIENQEWLDSLDYVLQSEGSKRAEQLLRLLSIHAAKKGVQLPFERNTPYINTIPPEKQPKYPGNSEIEARIMSFMRWNAMAMVVRANRLDDGIGGHIATFASSATLYEVGWDHFFRGPDHENGGDQIYFQGHGSPGPYARAYVEGRLTEEQMNNFRHEAIGKPALSSYPHPWLMPEFWQFPTVSMGLGPIMSIYQARFNRYLEDRGLKKKTDQKVWAFLGDGEMDEPESTGAISLAGREHLDNLIWVINCNLQRLDGPVRGNGKIIQELEALFRGAGWNVIKVIWGSDWDPLIANDKDGLLVKRLGEVVDGEFQKYTVETGEYIRKNLFGADPRLLDLVKNMTDEQIHKMQRGGHDPLKVYAAFKAAFEHTGTPTVVLTQSIKGYGMGESGEGRNITHQAKKINEEDLRAFRDRFNIPVSDAELIETPFYRPPEDSPEIQYIKQRRKELGGYLPQRVVRAPKLNAPPEEAMEEFYKGTSGRQVSSTMAFVSMLTRLLRDKEIGKLIVPIVPDEARTFGMESLFRAIGIYSHVGQLYEPVDAGTMLYYKEAKSGQLLEEGITEAGSMSSFIAAGTAYSTHGINMIPFFIYYSMFGFQRVGDLIWAAGDMRVKGFMVGGTAGRTTLAGEGLQHCDGHSQLLAYAVPNLMAYDPAFAYEIAVIVREGLRRMYEEQESIFYYLTVYNENYEMPAMPEGVKDGILKGMYRYKKSEKQDTKLHAQLFGSGPILNEALKAAQILEERYNVAADVWSVTSYQQLYRNGIETERWNMLHPTEERLPYVTECLKDAPGVVVAASDYVKTLPESISNWISAPFTSLGTDGFGRSDNRRNLRNFFEVDARYITLAALVSLAREKQIGFDVVEQAIKDLEINPDKPYPLVV